MLRIFARQPGYRARRDRSSFREAAAERLLATAAVMFSTGVRLALPVIAVLVMVDISLALLGRMNAQLQLLTIAFPIKMMLALTVFGWILVLLPAVMRTDMGTALTAAKGLLVR